MSEKKNELSVEHSQIYSTSDYDKFTTIEGNRNINPLHLVRLKKSIMSGYLFTIIIVNEKDQIIDGQHRYEAIKKLGLLIHYVVCNGYGLKEVQILNQNSKTWTMDDFVDGYCQLGYQDYIVYKNFRAKYHFSHTLTYSLLLNRNHMINSEAKKHFGQGLFKVCDYEKAQQYADSLVSISNYFSGIKDRNFVYAMIKLFDKPDFIFNELMHKLALNPNMLQPRKTIKQYIELIEDIYNYKRRDKVNLRF